MSPKSGTKKIMGGGMLFFDYNLEKTYLGDGILERYVAHLTPLIGLPMWLGMATLTHLTRSTFTPAESP